MGFNSAFKGLKRLLSIVESFAFHYPYNEQSFAEVCGFVSVVFLSAVSGWIFETQFYNRKWISALPPVF
jgi:hypothetical protein